MAHRGRLLVDAGGTHARLAWQEESGAALRHAVRWRVDDHAGPQALVLAYLAHHRLPLPGTLAMGVAADLDGDDVRFTNQPWSFSRAGLARTLGGGRLILMNDFRALAWALPDLRPPALVPVGGGLPLPDRPRAVIGPGTGLGVSGLLPRPGGGWTALEGEGGHVTLPVAGSRENAVAARLTQRFGHASAERALSGPGLVNLHDVLCALDGRMAPARTPQEVAAAGLTRADPCCREAIELFAAWLGSVAGNLALTLGARGGLYLGGGILPQLCPWFSAESRFRERFESKGRFSGYLAQIPVWVIDDPLAALRGLARALDEASDQPSSTGLDASSMPPMT